MHIIPTTFKVKRYSKFHRKAILMNDALILPIVVACYACSILFLRVKEIPMYDSVNKNLEILTENRK